MAVDKWDPKNLINGNTSVYSSFSTLERLCSNNEKLAASTEWPLKLENGYCQIVGTISGGKYYWVDNFWYFF